MATFTVTQVWDGAGGGTDESGQRTYTTRYRVLVSGTDPWSVSPAQVRLATGIPRYGDPYEEGSVTDLGARARSFRAERTEHPEQWYVTVSYANFPPGGIGQAAGGTGRSVGVGAGAGGSYEANPILRPAKLEFRTEFIEEAIWEDINGDAVVNSAGERFSEPLIVQRPMAVFVIRKNFLAFSAANAMAYIGTVNSDEFLGCAPRTCRIMGIEAIEAEETIEDPITGTQTLVTYAAATVTIYAREDGWEASVLDQGTYQVVSGERRLFFDAKTGVPVSQVRPLDGDGLELAVGAAPVFLAFQLYDDMEFAQLGLF